MLPNIYLYNRAKAEKKINKFLRRAPWHDYRSKSIYMITLTKMPGIPIFSEISGSIENYKAIATSVNTRLGEILQQSLFRLHISFPKIRVLQFIIMPDHIHALIEVKQPTPYHLGEVVRIFKQSCSEAYTALLLRECGYEFSGQVFTDGYHDRILTGSGQLQTLIAYIRDNPRRLFLKQQFPEAFRNRLLLSLSDMQLSIYGNPLLLECPSKPVVRFSSKFTKDELEKKKKAWDEAIREGSPIVSPFIHPTERECLDKTIANGGIAIIIKENGFPDRWKPELKYFDACAQGRLLFVGPAEHITRSQPITREDCLRLNSIAERLSALLPSQYTLRHK